MKWESVFSIQPVWLTFIGMALAAVFICWHAGSLHPLKHRLLRLFISRDDIEDRFMKQVLAESSALSALKLTYGIRVRTIKDAKRIIGRANSLNLPLRQIGLAGSAFDTETFTVVADKRPHSSVAWLTSLGLVISFLLLITFTLAANETRLLATLKETNTWIWLGKEDAQLARTTFSKNPAFIVKADCKGNQPTVGGKSRTAPSAPSRRESSTASNPRFDSRDKGILCQIWQDSTLQSELDASVREQRATFWLVAALMAVAGVFCINLLRHTAAVRLLEHMRGIGKVPVIGPAHTKRPRLIMTLRVGSWLSLHLRFASKAD